jgi:hypothetical protein
MKRIRIPDDLWWKAVAAAGEAKISPAEFLQVLIERGLKVKK